MNYLEPLISVIIPVYNVEDYIEEAIQSVLNQTYRNLQIIIVDDCSTDNTSKILSRFSKDDSRILLLRNEKNSKIVYSLNHALKFVAGEYIVRMDGDDISSLDRIKIMYDFITNNNQYDLVGSYVYSINEKSEIVGVNKLAINERIINSTLKFNSPILHIWLAKKCVYDVLSGYRDLPGVEDYDFLLRMKSLGFRFANIPEYLYSVRVRSGNTNDLMGFEQRIMHNYVYDLFLQRRNKKNDSFSAIDVRNYILKNEKKRKNYNIAKGYQSKYLHYRGGNIYLYIYYFTLCFFKSSICREYLLSRFIFKLLVFVK